MHNQDLADRSGPSAPTFTIAHLLAQLAMRVSIEAPLRLKSPGYQCYITHETVRQIRKILDDARIDWRAQHKAARSRGR